VICFTGEPRACLAHRRLGSLQLEDPALMAEPPGLERQSPIAGSLSGRFIDEPDLN